MSLSNEWTEWHLTPEGWVRGTEKEDFRTINREPPPDRVKTVVYKQRLASVYSKLEEGHSVTWAANDSAAISRLETKFGPPPRNL
ncbi:hypothetical protein ACFLEY_22385 [Bradyrhizobium sp. YCK136]|uniref:hypothetical protein n=1 Tax=Bradyrhizobium sp. YCK136 TaxID=3351346 RepID=UPI0037C7C92C